ncbi:MAG: hypothetical protein IPM98_15730 [Lewinellaceae bacterium]|nr:hypothetical protein [Lewinellaceae bacterium]
MTAVSEYLDFIKSKGRPLAEINPGSDEIALSAGEALEAIEILKDNELPILGGDIFSTDSGKLVYAYQIWGSEYHYLNWYCDEMENESKAEYSKRSYEVAKKAINEAVEVSQKLGRDCLIVIVV